VDISCLSGACLTVHLPVGLWADGVCHRDAALTPMTGIHEERFGDTNRWPSPAAEVTELLAASVSRIGSVMPIRDEHIRSLAILDRDVLLIALRRHLFGDLIQGTITCPVPECGKPIDMDFSLCQLPVPEMNEDSSHHDIAVGDCRRSYRLPNGGDQEAAAEFSSIDAVDAEEILLRRCIPKFTELCEADRNAVLTEMERHDPQLKTEFAARCPECGKEFIVHFDIQEYLLHEMSDARAHLYRDVHTLAWYYHWSEWDILSMPTQKRRMYLSLLADLTNRTEGEDE